MRIALAAAMITACTGFAFAEFYVVQNVQTGKCSIEQELPASPSTQVLLNNKFMDRTDAENALKNVPACN